MSSFLLHSDAPMQELQELRIYRVDSGLMHPPQPLAANADADATQTRARASKDDIPRDPSGPAVEQHARAYTGMK